MNAFEGASQALNLVYQLLPHARKLFAAIKRHSQRQPRFSYENLSVAIVVELKDKAGRVAEVTCRQRVRFLVAEAGVITSHVWGEGQRVKRLSLEGVRSLEMRAEGSRDLLLLGLKRRPGVRTTATLKARRRISGGFTKKEEYFEVSVERPTRLLSLKILFPKTRPPRDAFVSSGQESRDSRRVVTVAGGRAQLRWSQRSPELNRVYRLSWSW